MSSFFQYSSKLLLSGALALTFFIGAPFTAEYIEQSLEQWLEIEFTMNHVGELSTALAALTRDDQDLLLGWVRRISTTNTHLAHQFAIRHLTSLLNKIDTRTKLLITLSDGKPDDYNDGYRCKYGIEDTRKALVEAKRSGIHPFCITIDTLGRDYLPHMYGPANYAVIDEVGKLPLKVANVYRRLTI